jgi:hypothetical protein
MRNSVRWVSAILSTMVLAGCGAGAPDEERGDVALADSETEMEQGESVAVAPSESAELVETHIMDQSGFGSPMIAARAQLPSNWQTRGGIAWDRSSDCVSNHVRVNWLAVAPDGRQAMELMPGYSWQLQGTDIQMNPCPPLAIRTPQQFLQTIAQRYPGARILSYRDRPELAPRPQQTNGTNVEAVAGELLIAYRNGAAEIRELLTTTLTISELHGNICISSPVVYAYRVAGGEPDPEFSDRFMKSLTIDPQWMAQVQEVSNERVAQVAERQRRNIAIWHNNEMNRINARGAAERAQIRAQTNREVAQIYSNIWSNSQATDDRIQRRTLESIGGYNTYADPSSGGVVRGSIEYDRVIRTNEGNYIGTDDPYFNPAGSEELQRIP